MQSMMKTPTKPIPSKTVQSFNIAYPTAATAIQFNPVPGPGTYNPSKPKRNNKINFSASQRQPLISKQNSQLGPGSFEPKKISATSVKIGTSIRPPLAIPTSAPLPGKYEYQSKIIESQGIVFKGSSYDPIIKEIHSRPGPGIYNPEKKSSSPQYLFPKSQRHDFTKQKRGIPGPIYEIEEKPQTPQYSFGKCKR
ncbi:unnamed protein product (macronuclear) [Paramecium tetraurelia]|uniref:Uncharacterized protein n=1 Tax=Paramecium tetraurelia TaxID=5888 RepID=A0E5E1_PARTE|nr:uncharacterized protein GSPATT00023685001 [Paramecium tetraurelia]CAK90508.1 unnamed protein product [Paramecium tetraurelia]|eukprot:XP_001457905.1 hypothetical protein (macronuclear) [Paramecium tetraurelia strain d4-2]